MPLDPEAAAFLDQLQAAGAPQIDQLQPAEARQAFTLLNSLSAGTAVDGSQLRIEEHRATGSDVEVPLRLYLPEGEGPPPLVVYFHGGGWVLGSPDTHDGICRSLAGGSGCAGKIVTASSRLRPIVSLSASKRVGSFIIQWLLRTIAHRRRGRRIPRAY